MTPPPLVVLVEDDPNDQELARLALEQSGIEHRLLVVRNGVEAMATLLGDGGAPDARVVLLDLKMPMVDGLEVLERLRAHPRTRRLPIVVFTSSSEERDIEQSYARGASAYVRKPIDFTEYAAAVTDLGNFWVRRNVVLPALGDLT